MVCHVVKKNKTEAKIKSIHIMHLWQNSENRMCGAVNDGAYKSHHFVKNAIEVE